MDMLKRSMAPISEAAWREIESYAEQILRARLTVRRFFDVAEPQGWEFAGISEGRIDMLENQTETGVLFGIRKVLPVVETRIPFSLNIWELDNTERGARNIDLEPLRTAAERAAAFEDEAVLRGLSDAGLQGLYDIAQQSLPLGRDLEEVLGNLADALSRMRHASIEGPYALIVDPTEWKLLAKFLSGYPVRNYVEQILGGPIIYSAHVDRALLVSLRGGDFQFYPGQDFSIGYNSHDTKTVDLFITESFTYRVNEPKAAIALTLG